MTRKFYPTQNDLVRQVVFLINCVFYSSFVVFIKIVSITEHNKCFHDDYLFYVLIFSSFGKITIITVKLKFSKKVHVIAFLRISLFPYYGILTDKITFFNVNLICSRILHHVMSSLLLD